MKKQISTPLVPQADHIFSQGIEMNSTIYVAGQIHNNVDGEVIGGSVADKVAQIMRNMQAILGAADATIDDIVKVVVYMTDMKQLPEINETYPTYFTEPYPAREAIGVKELPLGATIEMSAIAVKQREN